MFSLVYSIFYGTTVGVDPRGMRPRDSLASHWREQYAEMEQELRRTAERAGTPRKQRTRATWKLAWPF